MRLSLYSYQFTRDGDYYLYNSETNLFLQVSEKLYRNLYNEEFSSIENRILQELIRSRFLINNEDLYNYYNEQRMRFMANSYESKLLSLVLVPTSGCNFACPYCFEGEKGIHIIDDDTITDLVDFINGHEKIEALSLTWYGGEPLMAFNKMKKIVERIRNEARLEIVSQSIITNGYLITDEMVTFFAQNEFKSIQITLDGIEENHNKTRFLASNHGSTYDRIISNIEKVTRGLPNCKISVRINVNKTNENDFTTLYELLYEALPFNNLKIYPGFIREETHNGHRMCFDSLFDNLDRYTFYEKMEKRGVNINFMPKVCKKGCMTNYINSYIIGPLGEIYKCWNDVNHSNKIIGNIKNKEITNKPLFYAYQNETTPYDDERCKECFFFPICSGGCAWYRFKNIKENKQFNVCTLIADKMILENCLLKSLERKEYGEKKREINFC